MKGQIFIVSGVPGSGKSAVAVALMRRFKFGLHVPVDDLREWVVSGIAHPVPSVTPETERQFTLARQSAAQLAKVYAQAGFAVAVDDVIDPENADTLLGRVFAPLPVYKVLLRPELLEALNRNVERTHKAFDTSILANVIRRIHGEQNLEAYRDKGWLIVDSSKLTIDETAEHILLHFGFEQSTASS